MLVHKRQGTAWEPGSPPLPAVHPSPILQASGNPTLFYFAAKQNQLLDISTCNPATNVPTALNIFDAESLAPILCVSLPPACELGLLVGLWVWLTTAESSTTTTYRSARLRCWLGGTGTGSSTCTAPECGQCCVCGRCRFLSAHVSAPAAVAGSSGAMHRALPVQERR